jgi:3-hydroxyacyl-CoA dehydrogenase
VIELHRHDEIAVLTINHPPVNSTSQAVRQGLLDGVRTLLDDDAVAGIVVIGANARFSAGGDVHELGDANRNVPSLSDTIRVIEASRKPVVAAMTGYALGGGLELALGCHWRIGMRPLRVGLPEVTLGLIPGAGGTQRLPAVIGAEMALDLITSGRHVAADEALALGLLDALVEAPLETAAVQFLRQLLSSATTVSLRQTKAHHVSAAFFDAYRKQHADAWRGQLAPWKAIDAIEACCLKPAAAAALERAAYLECQQSPQRAALAHVFLSRRKFRDGLDETRASLIAHRLMTAAGIAEDGIAPREALLSDRAMREMAAQGRVLMREGIASCEEEIDLVAIETIGIPAHLGGPMFIHRASR